MFPCTFLLCVIYTRISFFLQWSPPHTPSEKISGTSLVVQWLRIHLLMQGTRIWSLVEELRSHMPRGDKALAPQLLSLCSRAHATVKIPHAATKTRHSQRNENILKKTKKALSLKSSFLQETSLAPLLRTRSGSHYTSPRHTFFPSYLSAFRIIYISVIVWLVDSSSSVSCSVESNSLWPHEL